MHALRVVFGVDRDGLDAEFGSRARCGWQSRRDWQ
jgi:hypothetical protein